MCAIIRILLDLSSSSSTTFLWDSLNSEVDLELLLIRDWFHNDAENDRRVVPAGLLSIQFWEAVVDLEFSDTKSLQMWSLVQCSQLTQSSHEG